jgi:hypothetical protein
MANIRGGVFTLRTASRLKKDDNWFSLSDVWIATSPSPTSSSPGTVPGPPTATNGYFGGGGFPIVATMDKVTYSSDTTAAVPGANLSAARYYLTATGNSTAGYFGGGLSSGFPTPVVSTMDKVTYSSDTTAVVPGAALSSARFGVAATGNSTAGYFGGGSNSGFPISVVSTMNKVTYSSDTTAAVPGANLSAARYYLAATGNSTNGYFGGGGPGTFSTMDKVTYSSDTTAAVPGANLSVARYNLAATGNTTAGYFGGGFEGSNRSTMDKVTYSSDTTAAVPGAALSVARNSLTASSGTANGIPQPLAATPTPGPAIV